MRAGTRDAPLRVGPSASEDPAEPPGPPVLWLYGVTPEGQPLPQVDGVALEAIVHGGLVALVEPMSGEDFAPAVLEAKLQSIEWVARMARRHQAVLAAALAHGSVIPARLATLFSHRRAVTASLAGDTTRLRATLARVAGCMEWGLKVFCDHRRLAEIVQAEPGEAADGSTEAPGTTPGLAYIRAKQREARAAETAAERVDEVLDDVLDGIAPCAVETCYRPLLDPHVSGRDDAMELNLAALVERGREAAFQAAIREAEARFGPSGFTFQTSGPFAPYSFCDDGAIAAPSAPEATDARASGAR